MPLAVRGPGHVIRRVLHLAYHPVGQHRNTAVRRDQKQDYRRQFNLPDRRWINLGRSQQLAEYVQPRAFDRIGNQCLVPEIRWALLEQRFVSITYGAGGTSRDLTRDAVRTLHKSSGLKVAAHLTCVNPTREETLRIANDFVQAGLTDIVALRGDPPNGRRGFVAHPDGFASSVELIEALADTGDFVIRVGAYPDIHPQTASGQADIDWLKAKLDIGATEALTQFFFEADTFFRFRDACAKAGIDHAIIPGILPIENWKGARSFARNCGTTIPAWVEEAFDAATRDGRADMLATALCAELCSELIDAVQVNCISTR